MRWNLSCWEPVDFGYRTQCQLQIFPLKTMSFSTAYFILDLFSVSEFSRLVKNVSIYLPCSIFRDSIVCIISEISLELEEERCIFYCKRLGLDIFDTPKNCILTINKYIPMPNSCFEVRNWVLTRKMDVWMRMYMLAALNCPQGWWLGITFKISIVILQLAIFFWVCIS